MWWLTLVIGVAVAGGALVLLMSTAARELRERRVAAHAAEVELVQWAHQMMLDSADPAPVNSAAEVQPDPPAQPGTTVAVVAPAAPASRPESWWHLFYRQMGETLRNTVWIQQIRQGLRRGGLRVARIVARRRRGRHWARPGGIPVGQLLTCGSPPLPRPAALQVTRSPTRWNTLTGQFTIVGEHGDDADGQERQYQAALRELTDPAAVDRLVHAGRRRDLILGPVADEPVPVVRLGSPDEAARVREGVRL